MPVSPPSSVSTLFPDETADLIHEVAQVVANRLSR